MQPEDHPERRHAQQRQEAGRWTGLYAPPPGPTDDGCRTGCSVRAHPAGAGLARCEIHPFPFSADNPAKGLFEFVDDIFGGSIPRQFVPAVEKGIQDARSRGCLAGYPMVDFRVTVYDGSYHDVDSNELSFKLAGSLAFKDAMTRARPTILEPIMTVEVYAPSDFAGDLMEPNSRRGRIAGMDTRGTDDGDQCEGADGRDAHLRANLTSATGGRGSVPHGGTRTTTKCRRTCTRKSSRRQKPSAPALKSKKSSFCHGGTEGTELRAPHNGRRCRPPPR